MQRLKASESVPVRRSPLSTKHGKLTFDGEEAQVMDARFMNEVIRVCELVRDSDLTGAEEGVQGHRFPAYLVARF